MTALGIAYSRADADAALPNLADVLDLATVGGVAVEHVTGLVVDGCAYNVRVIQEWAACGCRDGLHSFGKDDPWFARGHWHERRADATDLAAKVRGHVVTHLVATSSVEEVR